MPTLKSAMPKATLPYQRVQLLLPNDLANFVDVLVQKLSPSGIKISRQDAIRNTLVKLQHTMNPPPPVPSTPAQKKPRAKK